MKRIVAITFVALLSLALAGTSIAEAKKDRENQQQMQALNTYKKALQSGIKSAPQQGTGPKSSTTGRGAAGRK